MTFSLVLCHQKKKWAPLIEYVLRPHLFTFLVDNIVDGLVFEELIEQNFPGYKPGDITKEGIVCPKFEVFSFFNAVRDFKKFIKKLSADLARLFILIALFVNFGCSMNPRPGLPPLLASTLKIWRRACHSSPTTGQSSYLKP